MPIDAPNFQFPEDTCVKSYDPGPGVMGVRRGTSVSQYDGFETVDNPLGFDEAQWTRTTDEAHTGSWSLGSDVTPDGGSHVTAINIGAQNLLEFWYKVSSEEGFDFFEVRKNSSLGPVVLSVSGEVDWTRFQMDVTGITSVYFIYTKDGSFSSGSDAAYLDDVTLSQEDVYRRLEVNSANELIVTIGSDVSTPDAPVIDGSFVGNIPDSASAVVLSDADPDRRGWFVFNDSTEVLIISFDGSVAWDHFSVLIPCGGFYEMPGPTIYTGTISGLWSGTSGGFARVTVLLPD